MNLLFTRVSIYTRRRKLPTHGHTININSSRGYQLLQLNFVTLGGEEVARRLSYRSAEQKCTPRNFPPHLILAAYVSFAIHTEINVEYTANGGDRNPRPTRSNKGSTITHC